MATGTKPASDELPPEQIWVEISPALYEAILQMAAAQGLSVSANELRERLEDNLSASITHTITEVIGVDIPFPHGVDVELQIIAPDEDVDDDDKMIRESIRQGLRDIVDGNTLTEAEFWKAVADDE